MDITSDADDFTQQNKSFREKKTCLPKGHVLTNLRWRNSKLAETLQSKVILLYDDDLEDIDFQPSSGVGVIYIAEAELIYKSTSYKKKMARQRRQDSLKIIVIVEKTVMSSQYYSSLQSFCVLQLGLVLLPVSNEVDAAGVLLQLVNSSNKPETNPFKKPRLGQTPKNSQSLVLTTLQSIPGLGSMGAKLLLLNFGSLLEIASASLETLTGLVGKSTALRIQNFLNS